MTISIRRDKTFQGIRYALVLEDTTLLNVFRKKSDATFVLNQIGCQFNECPTAQALADHLAAMGSLGKEWSRYILNGWNKPTRTGKYMLVTFDEYLQSRRLHYQQCGLIADF